MLALGSIFPLFAPFVNGHDMIFQQYNDAGQFLTVVREIFESNEPLYGLMNSLTHRLIDNPLVYGSHPLLATISKDDNPVLIALMTPPHKLQIASLTPDDAAALMLLAESLHRGGWKVPAVLAEERVAHGFSAHWCALHGCGMKPGMRQRIHELRAVNELQSARGYCRPATLDDMPRLIPWAVSFMAQTHSPDSPTEIQAHLVSLSEEGSLYVWDHNGPVSMAAFTRPTQHGVCISYVYTPPEQRCQGYATGLVTAMSGQAMSSGKQFCMLYTDLANPASNSIYRKIGYLPVADAMDIIYSSD